VTVALLASIPSPSDGTLDIGPLSIHAYGLMIALGIVAAVWLAGRRLEQSGAGTRDDMSNIAIWAVVAGVIGARLYYIITDKSDPWREPAKWIRIWEGGLGIPGGLILGVLVGAWAAKRRGVSVPLLLTAAAPAIPLAQAIGRLGNWWNQELFGRPTTLPWGLEIDDAHLPAGYPSGTLFHPTFLYECLWNLGLCLVLLIIDKRMKLRPGRLMAVYVLGYSVGRFWIEGLRIDPANSGGGWRLNQWMAVFFFVASAVYLIVDHLRHRNDPPVEPVAAVAADEDEAIADVEAAEADAAGEATDAAEAEAAAAAATGDVDEAADERAGDDAPAPEADDTVDYVPEDDH
jgi:prolipoprotein diacylglyceryl transferase